MIRKGVEKGLRQKTAYDTIEVLNDYCGRSAGSSEIIKVIFIRRMFGKVY